MGNRMLVVIGAALLAGGCLDIRDFAGTWSGDRVGDAPALKVGFPARDRATLEITEATLDSLTARLTVDSDVVSDAAIQPIAGAEADALAAMSFAGSPERVYLAFASTADGGGDALVIVALYGDPRVEVRILRGQPGPLYGVFQLTRD